MGRNPISLEDKKTQLPISTRWLMKASSMGLTSLDELCESLEKKADDISSKKTDQYNALSTTYEIYITKVGAFLNRLKNKYPSTTDEIVAFLEDDAEKEKSDMEKVGDILDAKPVPNDESTDKAFDRERDRRSGA
jgi:hypothetical protein